MILTCEASPTFGVGFFSSAPVQQLILLGTFPQLSFWNCTPLDFLFKNGFIGLDASSSSSLPSFCLPSWTSPTSSSFSSSCYIRGFYFYGLLSALPHRAGFSALSTLLTSFCSFSSFLKNPSGKADLNFFFSFFSSNFSFFCFSY